MANIYDMVDTWNDSGTTFAAIKMNVTDTASDAASLLMDLQVGGTSQFSVLKDGKILAGDGNGSTVGGFRFATQPNIGMFLQTTNLGAGSNVLSFRDVSSSVVFASISGSLRLRNSHEFGWSSGAPHSTYADLLLARDAANTLAQRNSTNAQTFNLYNTYTDASNYERGFMKWNSNVLEIGTEAAGTGTARALEFQTDGTTALIISSNQALQFGGTTSSFPALKPSGTSLEVKRADDSLYTNIVAASFSARSWYIDLHQRARVKGSGVSTIQLSNTAETDFDRLQFGGTTSSFPAIKRSTTSLQARLADDTDFTNIQGKLTTETAYTAGAPTATGYIVLYDSTGTAYKVPAEAV